jgi:peptidoglycan/LPS O-acetylase OafA/YrhL
VIYVHAYDLTSTTYPQFFIWIHKDILIYAFFIIGGYFIAKSWHHDANVRRFLTKRVLRVFPALIICILLTVFLLGPLVTDLPIISYFQSRETYFYLKNIFLHVSYYLPGVFTENIFPNAVNGSLWTLPIEFFLYICTISIGILSIPQRWSYPILTIISAIFIFFGMPESVNDLRMIYGSDILHVFTCGYYFWIGATFFTFNLKQYLSLKGAAIASIIFLISPFHEFTFQLAMWILWPYIVLSVGLAASFKISQCITRQGDFSYGIYIYAFPIQQTLAMFYPSMNVNLHILISIICVMPFAILSWKFIEQPMLRFKPKKSISTEPLPAHLFQTK